MKFDAYEKMFMTEDQHWWFYSKREIILNLLTNFAKDLPINQNSENLIIGDIGCGTGAILKKISSVFSKATIYGIDYSLDALEFCKNNFNGKLYQADLNQPQNFEIDFDFLVCSDVLEHIEKEDVVLSNLKRMLKDDGKLILTVPAYQFLWSTHDEWLDHKRRYSKKQLTQLLKSNNLKIDFMSYYNCFLFPIMLFVRLFQKVLKSKKHTDDSIPASFINSALKKIFLCEKFFLSKKIALPFGGSLICVVSKG